MTDEENIRRQYEMLQRLWMSVRAAYLPSR